MSEKRSKTKTYPVTLSKEEIECILAKMDEGHTCLTYPGDPDLLVEYGCDLHTEEEFCETDFCNYTPEMEQRECPCQKKFNDLKEKLEKLIKA